MKRLYYVFNLLLVIMIITLVFVGNTKVYGISIKTKSLKTSDFNSVQFRIDSPINDIANIINDRIDEIKAKYIDNSEDGVIQAGDGAEALLN